MNLQLESFTGYNGTPVVTLGDGTVAFPSGTGVAFAKPSGETTMWAPGDGIHEISAVCTDHQRSLFVCAEKRLKASLLVFSLPDKEPIQRIPDVASLSVVDMCFSRDGKFFAILSGQPNFTISIFKVEPNGKLVPYFQQKTPQVHQVSQISFNPRNPHELTTSGGGHVVFWKFDTQAQSLTPTEGRVMSSGVRLTAHAWLPNNTVICGSQSGALYKFDTETFVGRIVFDPSEDGSVTSLSLSKLHVVAGYSTGLIRFASVERGFEVTKSVQLQTAALSSVTFMPEWHTLVASGTDGFLELVHIAGYETMGEGEFASATPKASILQGFGGASLVGGAHFADSYAVAVVDNSGIVTCFDYSANTLLSKTNLGTEVVSCARGGEKARNLVITGHCDGVIRVVDISAIPKVVFRGKVTETPLNIISPDSEGNLVLLSDGSTIALLRVSGDLEVVCTVPLPSPIEDACFLGDTGLLLAYKTGELQHINVPDKLSIDATTLTAALDALVVNSWKLDLPVQKMIAPCVFDEGFHLFAIAVDKETKLYVIDRTLPADRKDRDTKPIKSHWSVRDHDKLGSSISIFREKWLLTGATDGRLSARDVSPYLQRSTTLPKDAKRDAVVSATRHISARGGISAVLFSSDQQRVVSLGVDGHIMTWIAGKSQQFAQQPFVPLRDAEPLVADANETILYPQKLIDREKELDLLQHEKYRDSIKNTIAVLRNKLQGIRAENDTAEEDEKVDLREFLVDRQRSVFEQSCDHSIDEMRERIRWENVNRDYVIDGIKRECWDVMDVKLTPLESLNTPGLVVNNFQVKKTTKRELLLLRKLKFMRRCQELDGNVRNVQELEGVETKAPEAEAEETEPMPFEAEEGQELPSLEAESLLEVKEFLMRPLLVFTRHRSILQMKLYNGRVRHLKFTFNENFGELVHRKKGDIQRIEERNVRCKLILKELEEKRDLFAPSFSDREKPELILTVRDTEVTADKATDPDEKARLAQEASDLERWRQRHGNDDSSDRALKLWMDGRLEKEIRTLEVKVDKPDFADENSEKYVPPDERSDEQAKIFTEYEKTLAKRIEEVNTRRKNLQRELANLSKDNAETAKAFDGDLLKLLQYRLKTSSGCFEVELQQVKLAQGMLLQEERQRIACKMEAQRAELEENAKTARQVADNARRELGNRQERLDAAVEREKRKQKDMRDKTIPPFSDSEEFGDLLYKLFMKRKPKKDKPGQKKDDKKKAAAKTVEADTSMDPFAFLEREEEQRLKAIAAEENAPLPRIERPEGIPDSLWDAFQNFRQERVDAERDIKRKEDEVAEMQRELEALLGAQNEAEHMAAESIRQTGAFHWESLREQYDLDELHIFKQGQVEVEQAPVVTDYADAILIHKKEIERLNELIRASSREKTDRLREINAKRKEIRLIDWEIEHLVYCTHSLEMEYRHLHTLRVTKQMQEFINGGGENHNEQQRQKLLQKIEHVRVSMTEKIQERQNQMLKLRRMIKEKDMENSLLLGQVGDSKTLVDDRRSIHDLQSSELDLQRTDKLMRDMRVTRKLEDVAKAQQEEMVALKKEIDRLRARTFPSFAVVSKRVVGNPDQL